MFPNTSFPKRFPALAMLLLMALSASAQDYFTREGSRIRLTDRGASHLASLPLKCIGQEFPVKPQYVMSDSSFTSPRKMHPAFYGCFDWHSSVHGHWLLVALLRHHPQLPERDSIVRTLRRQLTAEHIRTELALFQGDNKNFERPYGWGWLLQLQRELLRWDDPTGRELAANLDPLARHIAGSYIGYLRKLSYPVREPEHLNLAFSLCFAWDYAQEVQDTALLAVIRSEALRLYAKDRDCPVAYEPGGYDFLSPCLEEADLMQRVMPAGAFDAWLRVFLPGLYTDPASQFILAEVSDPTDGKIVHLHGLNFSRTWCLNRIAARMEGGPADRVRDLAAAHLERSFPHIASGAYEGEHWLASFAYQALLSFP